MGVVIERYTANDGHCLLPNKPGHRMREAYYDSTLRKWVVTWEDEQ